MKEMEMNKVSVVKAITKAYFVGALAGSFAHLVHAGFKAELDNDGAWQPYAVPFMIDGIAIIGMVMRSDDFSSRTRKIGLRVQMVMGAISLAGNMYAASGIGGAIFGAALVALYLFAEWLGDQIEGAGNDAVLEAERIAANAAQAEADRKAAIVAKRNATRKRNQRIKAQQTKALESLVNS